MVVQDKNKYNQPKYRMVARITNRVSRNPAGAMPQRPNAGVTTVSQKLWVDELPHTRTHSGGRFDTGGRKKTLTTALLAEPELRSAELEFDLPNMPDDAPATVARLAPPRD